MRLIEIRAELRRARTKLSSIWQRSAVKPLTRDEARLIAELPELRDVSASIRP
jgi:hypothetical protein